MNIWLITIGEQLPIKKGIRKLRTAYLADELIKRGHDITWWGSAFEHFKKEWIFEKEESNPTKTRLQRLLREDDLSVKTRGFSTLKVAFLLLNWTPENASIKSPILIKNASLQKIKSFKDKYSLSSESSYWEVNEVLSYYILSQTTKF